MTPAAPRRAALAAVGLVFALGGCVAGAFERPPPHKSSFVLDPGVPEAAAGTPAAGVLRVERVYVDPRYERSGFVWRGPDGTWDTDFYNEFFVPPGEMLRTLAIDWLDRAGVAEAVVRDPAPSARWRLRLEVEALYGDRRDAAAAEAVLGLKARLLEVADGRPALVLDRRYEAREPAAGPEPTQLVDAWNRALARVLGALAADLRRALGDGDA